MNIDFSAFQQTFSGINNQLNSIHNQLIQTYKQEYALGWINKDTVRNYVSGLKIINAEEYQEIVGEPYETTGVQTKG